MIDGKQYLIVKKQEDGCCSIKLASWFDESVTQHPTYVDRFYDNQHFYHPHKHGTAYVAMDKLPKFNKWKIEEPIEGERYLVYRVGSTSWYSPHYTIRKYHNGSFGSKDVKYWIKLSEVIEHEFNRQKEGEL